MEHEWEYELGDVVYLRNEVAHYELYNEISNSKSENLPGPVIIVERKLQECHGGVQRFYSIRARVENKTSLYSFTGMELLTQKQGEARMLEVMRTRLSRVVDQ